MLSDQLILILALAGLTFACRFFGYIAGSALEANRVASRVFEVLPGCLLAALVAGSLSSAPWPMWAAAGVCLGVSLWLRNVLLVMFLGVGLILGATYLGWV